MFLIGDKLGPYTLISELSGGRLGAVWLASSLELEGAECVLKIPISPDLDKEAFVKEGGPWKATGEHANIAKLNNVREYNGYVVIESEFYADGSLQKWIDSLKEEGKRVSRHTAITITLGILDGLKHLHSLPQPIIHRDLKPSNILLTGLVPHIADFGIARLLDETWKTHSGTHSYMAPEAFEDERSVKTDLWSVGVILYQLLDGRLPFSHVREIVTSYPLPPLPYFIAPGIQKVVFRLLEKDHEKRFGSALEVISALRSAVIEADYAVDLVMTATDDYRNGRPDAKSTLDLAVLYDPAYAPAYFFRACLYLDKEDLELSIADLSRAIELNPNYQVAYTIRGDVHHRVGNQLNSLQDWSEAIRIFERDASAYLGRAIAKRGPNRLPNDLDDLEGLDSVLHDLDSAIAIEPDCAVFYEERASVFAGIAKTFEAQSERDIKEAMSFKGDDDDAADDDSSSPVTEEVPSRKANESVNSADQVTFSLGGVARVLRPISRFLESLKSKSL